jgi:cold-inducible RNA-binding protein
MVGNGLRETQSLSKTRKMQNKLFVGNLGFDVTENDLQDLFAQHGSVVEVNLMLDRSTGRSRGFAFVTMATDEAAQAAIAALNGREHAGRALTVNVARPREERPGGGGGGGGYGGGRGGRGGGGGGGRDGGGGRRRY